jgi:hypothetical protein
MCVGVVLLVTGFFLAFYHLQDGLKEGSYTVRAGASLEVSGFLAKGDYVPGSFRVSGGNGQANLIIKNPSGEIIENWTATNHDNGIVGFTAQETGTYTLTFKNLDSVHDQTIVDWVAPHDGFHFWNFEGLCIIFLSIPFLLSAIFRLLGY